MILQDTAALIGAIGFGDQCRYRSSDSGRDWASRCGCFCVLRQTGNLRTCGHSPGIRRCGCFVSVVQASGKVIEVPRRCENSAIKRQPGGGSLGASFL